MVCNTCGKTAMYYINYILFNAKCKCFILRLMKCTYLKLFKEFYFIFINWFMLIFFPMLCGLAVLEILSNVILN